MLVIHDEALIQRLETLAAQVGRSVEDVLTEWVERIEINEHEQMGLSENAAQAAKNPAIDEQYLIPSAQLAQVSREMAFKAGNAIDDDEVDEMYGVTGEQLLEIVDKFAFSSENPIDETQADDSTFDRRDFSQFRPTHVDHLDLLPATLPTA
ncbi:MAG: hypothetical protein SGI73_23050 [Chloroflexota bacterium]|nr:hypothetical protein [Chloroflexota bacterium]